VHFIPPNDLVRLGDSPGGYTVIGAGKTSMDTCTWLLEQGVAPDKIRWIRPRDGWVFDRAMMQPLDNVGSYMQLQARWVQAAAEAESGPDFAFRLEEHGVLQRIDRSVEPRMFRGAILSGGELEVLGQIENVVRNGKVRRIGTDGVHFEDGSVATNGSHVYVNCTAAGVRPTQARPVFEPGRITLQYVTIGIVPWSAATIGAAEALKDDDEQRNNLCPPVTFSGETAELLRLSHAGMSGIMARTFDAELSAWSEASRLNPGRGVADHMDDPRVSEAIAAMGAHFGPAMANLEQRLGAAV